MFLPDVEGESQRDRSSGSSGVVVVVFGAERRKREADRFRVLACVGPVDVFLAGMIDVPRADDREVKLSLSSEMDVKGPGFLFFTYEEV